MTLANFIAERFEDLQPMSASILDPHNQGPPNLALDMDIRSPVGRNAVSLIYQVEALYQRLKAEPVDDQMGPRGKRLVENFEPVWERVFHIIGVWVYG